MRSVRAKVVAVTGAARGIGLATATALARAGARVGICDIDEVALKEAAASLPGEVLAVPADVTDPASLEAFLDRVEEDLGPLDVLVNNAGIMPVGHLLDEPEALARKTVELNLLAVVTGTKRALRTMVPRGHGHVITLASMAGESAMPGLATYNASKWGALGFTLATRAEFRERGIDVTAILPAFVNTELTAGTRGVNGIDNVEPEDVARAIVGAILRPKAKVYVPSSAGWIVQLTRLLPEAVQWRVGKLLGATDVMLDAVDLEARRGYDERIGKR